VDNLQRIKCIASYDGTNFNGFQSQPQPNNRTVQGQIERALQKIHKGENTTIFASGRTDAGVHAYGQVFHFDSRLAITISNWKRALNTNLPKDIYIRSVEEIDSSFHARYDVKEKTYRYRVLNREAVDVFQRNLLYHYPYPLDINKMKIATEYLVGTHDFTTFSSAKTSVTDKVRTLYQVDIHKQDDEIVFELRGNGFLYNMVRIIVGTLLEVGNGKRDPIDISTILKQRDRRSAGKTIPGYGLYLWNVFYN
jgi:tRNA pseudouridine38-40 synthase